MTETQIGKVYASLHNMEMTLMSIKGKLDEHIRTEEKLDELREKTCPKAPAIRKVQSDVDGLAGILRTHCEDHATEDEGRTFYQRASFKQFIATTGAIVAGVLIARMVGA